MKSLKRTETDEGKKARWYNDACGTALALEFVGERWSLLIMRELLLGPRRFSELRSSLRGISANILTQRLEGLESSGIVARRKLPSPASVQVYELTPWGYESEPIFQEMGRWATRSRLHDPSLPLSPVSAMLSLRTMIVPDRENLSMTLAFHLSGDAFFGRLTKDDLTIERGETPDADVTFQCDPTSFVRIVYGKWPIEEAEAAGVLRFGGDRKLAERFISLLALPPKLA